MPKNEPLKLAVAGVGNNISALLQGVYFYRHLQARGQESLPGIRHPMIGGLGVADVEFVAAYDVNPNKIGKDLRAGALAEPNNYPVLDVELPAQAVEIENGLQPEGGARRETVVKSLAGSGAEVLLYSLPTGLQQIAEEYALAAADAGVAFVNCTPEIVARSPEIMAAFEAAGLPLIGDDLAGHLGTSVLHRALLGLVVERGLTLESSYQLNFGGNEDFRNLREHGNSKQQSKLNALARDGIPLDAVEVIPSAGYISHLRDNKVAVLNVEARGWAGTSVSIDVKLKVQDSSNAAGVIIDLIRIAAVARRAGSSGFPLSAAGILKSPAVGHDRIGPGEIDIAAAELERLAAQPTLRQWDPV